MILMMSLMALVIWLMLMRVRRGTAELLASEAQAKHLAFHDALTGPYEPGAVRGPARPGIGGLTTPADARSPCYSWT